jgi:hypothetical protein
MRLPTFACCLVAALPVSQPAAAETWTLPPAGYTYSAAPPCLEDAEKAERPLRPGGAVYKVCNDQMAYLASAIADARAAKKLLIVTVGATWCPWCAALQRLMPGPEFFGRTGDPIDWAKTFNHIEIGVSTTHKGKNQLIPSGDAVVQHLLPLADGVKLKAIPFIFVLDPEQPQRVFARNTMHLSDFSKGQQDMAGFRKTIAEGHAYLTAPPAPSPAKTPDK